MWLHGRRWRQELCSKGKSFRNIAKNLPPPFELGDSDLFNQSSTRCWSGSEALLGANPLLTSSGTAISLYLSIIFRLLLSSNRRRNASPQSLVVLLLSERGGTSSRGTGRFGNGRSSERGFELKFSSVAGDEGAGGACGLAISFVAFVSCSTRSFADSWLPFDVVAP